jgi:hypothetical protein
MNTSTIMVTQSDLFDALKGDMHFTLDEVENFTSVLEYIEDETGEWFALNQSTFSLVVHANMISPEKMLLGWVAFWMCVYNGSENNSFIEQQALGAIRAIFFISRHDSEIVPAAISVWWEQTNLLHHCESLGEQAA